MYERAFRGLRDGQPDAKEEAVMLLEAWRTFEAGCTSRCVDAAAGGVAGRGGGHRIFSCKPGEEQASACGGRCRGQVPSSG